MPIIDCHCDTLTALYYRWKTNSSVSLLTEPLHLNLEKMKQSSYLLQNFAIFLNLMKSSSPMETCLDIIDFYYQQLHKNQDIIAPVFCFSDIVDNHANGKISAMLTLEEGGILEGKLSNLRNLYRLGARMMTLTWNYDNELAGAGLYRDQDGNPNPWKRRTGGGLTPFGFEVIEEMERLGMIIDVSHLSDEAFFHVLHHTKKPFVASHSNSASICPICRNLTDDMIKALGERGGIIGLNFCEDFITSNAGRSHDPEELQNKFIQHAHYIIKIGGIDVLALGSDFDGISGNAWLTDALCMEKLRDKLKQSGFTENEVEQICYKNVLRLYQDVL